MHYILLILCLSGCNFFGGFKPDSQDIVSSNWATNSPPETPEQLYCYKTLGELMCYKKPLTNSGDRLVGVQPIILPEEIKQENSIKSTYNNFCKQVKESIPG